MIQNNWGKSTEDPYAHVEHFLDIYGTIKKMELTKTQLRLVSSILSTRRAKYWFVEWEKNSIKSWDDLKSKFMLKFFAPNMVLKKHTEITLFAQKADEMLYEHGIDSRSYWEHVTTWFGPKLTSVLLL